VNFLLRGGTVIDPALGLVGQADVRVREQVIAAIGRLAPEPGERVIEVDGLCVTPGLIDVHVHLREPGQEWKETLSSGTEAAAAGGFTTIFCMPNTDPALESVVELEELRRRVDRDAIVNVMPIATISERRRGRRAADYYALAKAGAVGFSDDGESTADSAIMVKALAASRVLNKPVMVHCEDPWLTGGAMHEGDISLELGIRGIPALAEESFISRDLGLAAMTGGWLHVCHVSTLGGVERIERARRQGTRVTAEVTPHHLVMSDRWVTGLRQLCSDPDENGVSGRARHPDTKVNPPLRMVNDATGLLQGLRKGTIDVIATDHAPHTRPEKEGRSYQRAAFGLSGSEFALPSILTIVRRGDLSMTRAIAAMTIIPARLWGLPGGTLAPGAPADVIVFDSDEPWRVDPKSLASRGTNTPLLDMELRGRVKMTIVSGDVRYCDW
jgi:dihydroorotase